MVSMTSRCRPRRPKPNSWGMGRRPGWRRSSQRLLRRHRKRLGDNAGGRLRHPDPCRENKLHSRLSGKLREPIWSRAECPDHRWRGHSARRLSSAGLGGFPPSSGCLRVGEHPMASVRIPWHSDFAPLNQTRGEPLNQQQPIMKTTKTLILSFLMAAAAMAISSCTTVVEPTTPPAPSPKITTTTTERSTLHHPSTGTTETKTTRTY